MSASKRPSDDQDPDYLSPGPTNAKQQKLYEETARANTANKIITIVEKEFSKEIDEKEKEVLEIQSRLHKALKTLHLLRYVVITDFYNRKQCQASQTADTKQTQIHPAIKRLIGKTPRRERGVLTSSEDPKPSTSKSVEGIFKPEKSDEDDKTRVNDEVEKRLGIISGNDKFEGEILRGKNNAEDNLDDEKTGSNTKKKIPRYIPPKSSLPPAISPSRGVRHKVRKRIVVGNISKWIPPDWREDGASHKWMMYVRGSKDAPDITDFVGKVRFFLHPSYQPNDVVQVVVPPFHLSRRGWGEFPLRVQLHFKNSLNKPMDIIHYLKLDRTYTGLQTLGSETVVDIWIHTTTPHTFKKNLNSEIDSSELYNKSNEQLNLKEENEVDLSLIKKECPEEPEKLVNSLNTLQTSVKLEPIERRDSFEDNFQMINENCIKIEHNYVSNNKEQTQVVHSMENNVTIRHSPANVDNDKLDSILERNENTAKNLDKKGDFCLADAFPDVEKTDKNETENESEDVKPAAISNGQLVDILESEKAKNLGKNLQNGEGALPVPIKLVKCNDKFFFISDIGKLPGGQVDLVKIANSDIVKNILAKRIQPSKVSVTENSNGQNGAEKEKGGVEIDSRKSFPKEKNFTEKTVFAKNVNIDKLSRSNSQQSDMQRLAFSLKSTPSKSEPLRITIPPPFEVTGKKQILVLKNNKLMSVNSSISASLNSKQFLSKSQEAKTEQRSLHAGNKVSLISSSGMKPNEGISLLKPSVSILKKPVGNNSQNLETVRAGTVLKINPSNSLLLNSNSAIPALQIATFSQNDRRNLILQNRFGQMKLKRLPKNVKIDNPEESRPPKVSVTLGKDKQKILSKKDVYENVLRSIDNVEIEDPVGILRYIIKRIPLVTEDARDLDYKQMHPYACCTQEEFFNYHLGKQRAHEWYRAKMVRSLLRKKGFEGNRLWSVKEILNWARFHGFTPVQSSLALGNASKSSKKLPETNTSVPISTCTESMQFNEWIENCKDSNNSGDESDLEIDVVHVADKKIKTEIKTEPPELSEATITLEIDPPLQLACAFVNETAREIGIRLQKEEIVPGVADSAAERVIAQAMQCLVDDLVRRSLAKAWERNGNKCPDTIMIDDVRGALLSRNEFDVFTNEGLASLQNLG